MYPDQAKYETLAKEYAVVPVYEELLADADTPVSVLQRFAHEPNVFLLESVEGGETWGRFSFIGVEPQILLETPHAAGTNGGLEALRNICRRGSVAPVPGLPRFCGGAVGFLGYESVGEFERMPEPKPTEAGRPAPCSRFLKADKLIVFDNIRHTAKVIVCTVPAAAASPAACYGQAVEDIERILARLRRPPPPPSNEPAAAVRFESNMSKAQFCGMVSRAKDYIRAGDAIQVVLSQRFSCNATVPPVQMYRALRLLNPSPYMFFFKIGGHVLVGSSPEVMVRLEGSRVAVRPIAGTRPRGKTEQEDRRLADELLSDEKEKAEHVMLVDLGRNDLGRISEAGSVQVREYMVIERYSHVMHIVSHVEGILRREFDAYDVVKACFPAGTLSGAPKIRAMEIIHELEPQPRGVYGGAFGYIGYDGNMDMAITIRTIEAVNGTLSIQAGAGIVFDSDPEKEFEETCHKSRGMQKAVEMAAGGLHVPQRAFEQQ